MATSMSFAQKVTKENLQGKWQIVAIDASQNGGVYIDLVKGDVEFSEAIKSQSTEEALNMAKAEFAGTIEMLKLTTMNIDNDIFTMAMATDVQKGKYSLGEKDGNQVIFLTFDNGTEDSAKTYFKDNLLYIDTVSDGVFIYKKA